MPELLWNLQKRFARNQCYTMNGASGAPCPNPAPRTEPTQRHFGLALPPKIFGLKGLISEAKAGLEKEAFSPAEVALFEKAAARGDQTAAIIQVLPVFDLCNCATALS